MRPSKKLAAVAIVAGIAITATAAFAYWTSSGTGSGSAGTGDAAKWDVSTDTAVGDPLSPAGPTDVIGFHVKNNGSGHQKLQSVAISVAKDDGSAWASGACTKADFSVGSELAGVSHTELPAVDLAPGDTYDGSVSLQMVNAGGNQNDCKTVTVPLYFDAS